MNKQIMLNTMTNKQLIEIIEKQEERLSKIERILKTKGILMSNKILNLDLSKDPIMPAIVYGRVGDDRLQTVTVNLTRRDEVADLTGYDITFEGTTYNRQTKVLTQIT
ncbi:BppU family phage baseplate upper protein [Enterococcus avium]|uniref:BppU family phage baseplate upper protein n=1 Tax=Enterococcus avium TaxID=33945 RepID=UPI001D0DF3E8|nr:BppU family phage baseplate upper protein [Enterococcus avium]